MTMSLCAHRVGPCRESDPANAHPRVQWPLLERVTPPPGCLLAPGQWRGLLPSFVWTRHRAVKQGQSGVRWPTDKGKGREARGAQIDKTGRSRALGGQYGGKRFKERTRVSGKRPTGAASFRKQSIQAPCQPPPPPLHPLQAPGPGTLTWCGGMVGSNQRERTGTGG